jgi:hypothetical protein
LLLAADFLQQFIGARICEMDRPEQLGGVTGSRRGLWRIRCWFGRMSGAVDALHVTETASANMNVCAARTGRDPGTRHADR